MVKARVLAQYEGKIAVEVNGKELVLNQGRGDFVGAVHFHGNDTHDYWCWVGGSDERGNPEGERSVKGGLLAPLINGNNTRCLFISFGG